MLRLLTALFLVLAFSPFPNSSQALTGGEGFTTRQAELDGVIPVVGVQSGCMGILLTNKVMVAPSECFRYLRHNTYKVWFGGHDNRRNTYTLGAKDYAYALPGGEYQTIALAEPVRINGLTEGFLTRDLSSLEADRYPEGQEIPGESVRLYGSGPSELPNKWLPRKCRVPALVYDYGPDDPMRPLVDKVAGYFPIADPQGIACSPSNGVKTYLFTRGWREGTDWVLAGLCSGKSDGCIEPADAGLFQYVPDREMPIQLNKNRAVPNETISVFFELARSFEVVSANCSDPRQRPDATGDCKPLVTINDAGPRIQFAAPGPGHYQIRAFVEGDLARVVGLHVGGVIDMMSSHVRVDNVPLLRFPGLHEPVNAQVGLTGDVALANTLNLGPLTAEQLKAVEDASIRWDLPVGSPYRDAFPMGLGHATVHQDTEMAILLVDKDNGRLLDKKTIEILGPDFLAPLPMGFEIGSIDLFADGNWRGAGDTRMTLENAASGEAHDFVLSDQRTLAGSPFHLKPFDRDIAQSGVDVGRWYISANLHRWRRWTVPTTEAVSAQEQRVPVTFAGKSQRELIYISRMDVTVDGQNVTVAYEGPAGLNSDGIVIEGYTGFPGLRFGAGSCRFAASGGTKTCEVKLELATGYDVPKDCFEVRARYYEAIADYGDGNSYLDDGNNLLGRKEVCPN